MFIRMPYACVVQNCHPTLGKRYLRFPKHRAQQLQWIENLNVPQLLELTSSVVYNKKRVCDKHFRAEDVIPAYYPGAGNRALQRGSVPIPIVQRKVPAVTPDVPGVAEILVETPDIPDVAEIPAGTVCALQSSKRRICTTQGNFFSNFFNYLFLR